LKTFKVVVDGQTYTVQVEEIEDESKNKQADLATGSQAPKSPTGEKTVPSTNTAPSKEQEKEAVKESNQETASTTESKTVTPESGITLKAPMPGSVLDVRVSEGESVAAGDVLLVLEAMKMENELTASQAGTVVKILVNKGDTVENAEPLVILS